MNEELRLLLESMLNSINDLKARVTALEEEDTLTQAIVKSPEPVHPYKGKIWVDTT